MQCRELRLATATFTKTAATESRASATATRIYTVPAESGGKPISRSNIRILVDGALRGEAQALEQLAQRTLRPAYSVALAIVRRPADAEDVAQDALLTAFERIETCRDPDRFVAWLMTIVRNQAKNWLDRRRLRDVPAQAEPAEQLAPERDIDGGFVRDRLVAALGHLNLAEREVVLLHDLEGFTHPEISDALGISSVNSRQYLFVARRKLRAVLDDGCGAASAEEGGNDE
jgi:RNA polymerase sigma-70 factor, ECF subfamily